MYFRAIANTVFNKVVDKNIEILSCEGVNRALILN